MYNDLHIASIGIDYRGTPNQLGGCIADLRTHQAWGEELKIDPAHRWEAAETKATFAGITDCVLGMFERMGVGDLAIITRSGHGTRVPDRSGDEASGFDSAFVPYDYKQNLYLDDQWFQLMQKRKQGTFVLLIDDFCHSGTSARAFHADAVGQRRFVALETLQSQGLGCEACERICTAPRAFLRGGVEVTGEGIAQITGCTDDEYSYDSQFPNTGPNGAMTYFLHRARKQLSVGATLSDWHKKLVPGYLPAPGRYPQTPQFNGSDAMKAFIVPGFQVYVPPAPPVPAPAAVARYTLGGKTFEVREVK